MPWGVCNNFFRPESCTLGQNSLGRSFLDCSNERAFDSLFIGLQVLGCKYTDISDNSSYFERQAVRWGFFGGVIFFVAWREGLTKFWLVFYYVLCNFALYQSAPLPMDEFDDLNLYNGKCR